MKIKTIQKPIEYDIYLKYICNQCGSSHWLSIKESSTKNFKVVCHCNNVFKVKRTDGFKLLYKKKKDNKKESVLTENNEGKTIDSNLLKKSISALVAYGFTTQEATEMIQKSYEKNPCDNVLILVKQTLEKLRG